MPRKHGELDPKQLSFFVLTISDTRTRKNDDSGRTMVERMEGAGHRLVGYDIEKDNPDRVRSVIERALERVRPDVVLINGGTGISSRDQTYEALSKMLDKRLPGFGEFFRSLSVKEIGPRTILSRAIAGVMEDTLVFSVPGSTSAVKLAMDKIILPVVSHAVGELRR